MFWKTRRNVESVVTPELLSATALRRVTVELEQIPQAQVQNQAVQLAARAAKEIPLNWERDLVRLLDGRAPLPDFTSEAVIVDEEVVGQNGFVINIDRPGIVLRGCSNFRVTAGGAVSDRSRTCLMFLTLIDCHDFEISDITLCGGRNGLVMHRCSEFRVDGLYTEDFHGYGLIVFACRKFDIANVVGYRNLAGTVLCLGATSSGRFRDVLASGGQGFFNCDAGLHINHCTEEVGLDQLPGEIHEARSITEKTEKPTMLIFEDVTAHNNRAQGVYAEGAVACVFRRLRVYSNNKEGICLDWGSILCTLEDCWASDNGARRGMTPAEIDADFIHQFGILEDGSSAIKLPGISFDNGPFNIVQNSEIAHNHGGGVKLVRASPGCALWDNRIKRNNLGNNPGYKFLEIHSADLADVNNEFKPDEALLDFGPSPGLDQQRNLVS